MPGWRAATAAGGQSPGVGGIESVSAIDIVADGKIIEWADFQGRPGCLAPHNTFSLHLPAGPRLLAAAERGAPGADVA